MAQTDEPLLEQLRETGETLPYELRRAILEAESDALVAGLIDIVEDEDLRPDSGTFGPPHHAATLLGLMGARSATGVLVELVREEGAETSLGEVAGRALQNMGSEVGLPAVLEACEESDASENRRRFARVLGGFEGENPAVVRALARELSEQPVSAQPEILLALERFGHESAVPRIREWLEEASPDPEHPDERFLIEIAANVLRGLGAEPDADHRQRLEQARGVDGPA
jgi:HEAT repeat protein